MDGGSQERVGNRGKALRDVRETRRKGEKREESRDRSSMSGADRKDGGGVSRNLKCRINHRPNQGQQSSFPNSQFIAPSKCPLGRPLSPGSFSRREPGTRGLEGAGTRREKVRERNTREERCVRGVRRAGSVSRGLGSCCSLFLRRVTSSSLRSWVTWETTSLTCCIIPPVF